jgi:hypothetical protein
MKKNFEKNKGAYALVRFVVTSENNAKQLSEILNEDRSIDPVKYRIDTVEFESLNVIEPKPVEKSEEKSEQVQAAEPLSKLEERIMTRIVKNGFTSREALVQDCRGAGIQVSARSVSRCLKALTGKALLQRDGKGYLPTETSRSRFA